MTSMPETEKPTTAEANTAEEVSPTRRRVVIVGAGQTGRALARTLSDSWDIAVLDIDAERLERELLANGELLVRVDQALR